MHPQIAAIVQEFQAAQERLHLLAERVAPERWAARPEPARWSVAECVAHLNLTGHAYLPVLRGALEEARGVPGPPPARYRRDPVGWMLWTTMGPPVRVRVRTAPPFVPTGAGTPDELVAEFDRLQDEQLGLAREADGLPLTRVWVRSPFDARVGYNAFSCLSILPRHQHRHLWQAERAAG